jgi:Fe-S cluster assembly iron-binding protein IscA
MPLLQVSNAAIAALEEARAAQDIPEDHGLRVSAEPDPQDPTRMSLGLGFTEQPADGDQVTEQAGTEVYIAPEIAEPLADSVLDIEDSEAGPQLVIRPQDDGEEA